MVQMLPSFGIICEVAMYLISSFLLLELLGLLWRYLVWPKDDCSIHWALGQWLGMVVGCIEL